MENDILYSVLPWLVLFLCCTVLVVYYLRIKHKERLRIIEKGDFALESNYLRNHKFSILSKGVILLSLSIGIGIAFAITNSSSNDQIKLPVYLIAILGSSGTGLLVYYLLIRKETK